MQGWKDYKKLMDKVELADYKYTKESKGSSVNDVDAFFKDKKGVKRQKIDSGEDGIKQVNYWYVTGSKEKVRDTNYPEFYTEILTKYKDGKLVYASVEPGLYHVSFKDAISQKDGEKIKKLNDLISHENPHPVSYSVAQMKYKALPITNVSMFLDSSKDDEHPNYLAYYNFSPLIHDKHKNHKVISVNTLPFQQAQVDFGNCAYIAMQEGIKDAE
ncbi:hypothetical protein ACO2FP_01445 [Staphylococcus warneri]